MKSLKEEETIPMNNTIYHGDLFDFLSKVPDNTIDLVLTSPPYFNARNYGGEVLFTDPMDWLKFCLETLNELKRVIKPEGVIWWNTGSGFKDYKKMLHVYALVVACDEMGLGLIDEIPWIKKSSPPKRVSNRPYPAWEHNYIFGKNPELVEYHRDNVRREYSKSTLERMNYEVSQLSGDLDGEYDKRKKVEPNPKGATPPNYILEAQDTTGRPHPATMLPQLASWAIRAYTEPGEMVLDPMMGAGTTAVEATKLERQWMGSELYLEYIGQAILSLERLERGEDPYRGLRKEWEERGLADQWKALDNDINRGYNEEESGESEE